MFWSTPYLGEGRKEVAYGEALGRNSCGSGNHGGYDGGRLPGGQCPDDAWTANLRTLATSALRVGVGMAVYLELEVVS